MIKIHRYLLLVSFITPTLCIAQASIQPTAITLRRAIEQQHIAPRPVNDSFSAHFYHQFLQAIDEDYLLLTSAQHEALTVHRYAIDEELSGGRWALINTVHTQLQKRLTVLDELLRTFLAKPFTYVVGTSVNESSYNEPAATEAILNQRWQQTLTSEIAGRVHQLASRQLAANNTINRAALQAKVPELFTKIITRHRQQLQAVWGNAAKAKTHLETLYLQTLAHSFDPHTAYFSTAAKQSFQQELDTEGFYYGFTITDGKSGEVEIEALAPGSPAWRSGQINKGDVLLQFQSPGSEPVDLELADAHEANSLIDEIEGDSIVLTLRKTNGVEVQVPLKKEKLDNDAQAVRSYLLDGPKKIGYIYLPSFYTAWGEGGSSCAADVAREVLQLKRDGMEALLLDVRFNGGGSVQEALELTGIFINEGPLCLVRSRDNIQKAAALKDAYRGTVWDGPMLVLVNGASASASELLAAALQDYNRAVIAGSTTHGKATGQSIEAVDTTSTADAVVISEGSGEHYMKITNGRIYRLTGSTAQASGVVPHILLPDAYEALYDREKDLPNALLPDTATANKYYQPLAPLPIAFLQSESKKRVDANDKFTALQQMMAIEDKSDVKSRTPDEWEQQLKTEVASRTAQRNIIKQPSIIFKAKLHSAAQMGAEQADALNRINSDPYIGECYQALADLINTKQKPL